MYISRVMIAHLEEVLGESRTSRVHEHETIVEHSSESRGEEQLLHADATLEAADREAADVSTDLILPAAARRQQLLHVQHLDMATVTRWIQ